MVIDRPQAGVADHHPRWIGLSDDPKSISSRLIAGMSQVNNKTFLL